MKLFRTIQNWYKTKISDAIYNGTTEGYSDGHRRVVEFLRSQEDTKAIDCSEQQGLRDPLPGLQTVKALVTPEEIKGLKKTELCQLLVDRGWFPDAATAGTNTMNELAKQVSNNYAWHKREQNNAN